MNLTLSLAIDGGGAAAAAAVAKKSKVVGGGAVVDGIGSSAICGGDRGSRVRDRMVKKAEAFDHEEDGGNGMAATSSDGGGGGGIELVHLLLSAVAAGEAGDVRSAAAALREVDRRTSCRGGDPAQRVAACYGDALASRLPGLRPARSPAATRARAEQFLAYTMFYQASPFYQFAHFTANQAIVEAFEAGGRRRLHVVDFDVSYGFQWPSLIQSLSDAAAAATSSSSHDDDDGGGCGDGPVSLRITGFSASADELRETEARLVRFAAGCPNLRFEFEGILNGSNSRHDCIKIDDDATVVVNLVFPAAQNASTTSSREACASTTMAYIHSLNPSMVFLIEKHDGGGDLTGDNAATGRSASLLPQFAASLRYFAAVFDSLHECLPADSAERLAIERNHLGREIGDAVASLVHHHRRRHGGGGGGGDHATASWNWEAAMEGSGFDGVKLSSRTVSQAKLLLKMKSGCGGSSGGGFRVMEGDGGRAMSLAWRDMALATATVWRRRRRRRRRCR